MGRTARVRLRGFSTDLVDLHQPDLHHRVHHRWCRYEKDTGVPRRELQARLNYPEARADTVVRLRSYAGSGFAAPVRLESNKKIGTRVTGRSGGQFGDLRQPCVLSSHS